MSTPFHRLRLVASTLAVLLTAVLGRAAEALPGFKLEGTTWTYTDGDTTFRGILVKPDGPGPFPAILISHGRGGSAEVFGAAKARDFVKMGFVCIAPTYTHAGPVGGPGANETAVRPGAPRAGEKKNETAVMPPPGAGAPGTGASDENLRRARKCLDILESLPYVDAKRLAAYGNSMGAFVTVRLSAEESHRLKAAAITAGGVWGRTSVIADSQADGVRVPLCMLHGGSDTTVPPESSAKLKEVLDRNHVSNERHVFQGIGHSLHQQQPAEVNRLMRAWFTKFGVLDAMSNPQPAVVSTPSATSAIAPGHPSSAHAPRAPGSGLLYYAKADYASADNQRVIANPYITGALFQIIWSEVEKKDGECDWSEVDGWIKPWLDAGKKIVLRVMWSTSGAWNKPYYKTPTPGWVWKKGAVFAFHPGTGTEIPVIWDPIYKQYAWRFLEKVAARYGDNSNLLFVDVTPGAETNPYRFGTINRTDPAFKDVFERTKASDGRAYGEELWLETIKEWVDAADRIFRRTPVLVTLNVGGLRAQDRLSVIGDYCINRGFYVGQNGLGGRSYRDPEGDRTESFLRWSGQSKLFFEMVQKSGGNTGTLMEVMQAAERIHCSYLNVYPEDVLRGTPGEKNFDPTFEAALKYGAQALGKK